MPSPIRICFLLLASALLVGSCKSVDKVLFQPSPAALVDRLPSLEIAVENGPLDQSTGASLEDAQRLFERDVRMNLSDPEDTARYGYARLLVKEARTVRTGKVLQSLQMLTFMTPSLLGVPLEWYETDLKAAVQIISAKGDTLATYTGAGKSRVRVAMYHGYPQTQAHRLADMEALRLALAHIKPQLDLDAARLREALLTAGKVRGYSAAAAPPDGSARVEP
ncbi:hypothetical protein LJ737_13850 [Hymenobacter sp. 15J16-1T3B]|uniref:hypothetical protein n=1 Tax=Hymenobacter sp. 15J16-1T3B TaxID=2886941 RepID=UPI001D12E041|nr:hypothetical protein [Hymenobacter sp. 15J16-1T3B]MCC3158328.1 hypothetical protein [Hymenobacter sp. 15J16-1T3B]